MHETVVVDSGYLIEYIMPTSQASKDQARQLINKAISQELTVVVPSIFNAEIAKVCAKGIRSKRLSQDDADEFLSIIETMDIAKFEDTQTPRQLFNQAMQINGQVYDTIYVMLAKQLRLPIATVDSGMRQAAINCKVDVYGA